MSSLSLKSWRNPNRRIATALFGVALVVGGMTAATASQTRTAYKSDDCATFKRTDERQMVWYEHIGDEFSEVCYGTEYRDIFWMKYGDDKVRSYEGADSIHLGDGRDFGFAGPGYDRVYGGVGRDTLFGGRGDDRLLDGTPKGGGDWDCLLGGPGTDRVDMGDGDMMDGFWAGKGWDPYPESHQFDSFCGDGSGGCEQDGIWQAESGPCKHDPSNPCEPKYGPEECLKE